MPVRTSALRRRIRDLRHQREQLKSSGHQGRSLCPTLQIASETRQTIHAWERTGEYAAIYRDHPFSSPRTRSTGCGGCWNPGGPRGVTSELKDFDEELSR